MIETYLILMVTVFFIFIVPCLCFIYFKYEQLNLSMLAQKKRNNAFELELKRVKLLIKGDNDVQT